MSSEVIVSDNIQELSQKESLLSTTVGDYQSKLTDFLNYLKLPKIMKFITAVKNTDSIIISTYQFPIFMTLINNLIIFIRYKPSSTHSC